MPTGWGSWFSWISWRVEAWKDRKIKAITAAGKPMIHITIPYLENYSQRWVFMQISQLWWDAIRYISWNTS